MLYGCHGIFSEIPELPKLPSNEDLPVPKLLMPRHTYGSMQSRRDEKTPTGEVTFLSPAKWTAEIISTGQNVDDISILRTPPTSRSKRKLFEEEETRNNKRLKQKL